MIKKSIKAIIFFSLITIVQGCGGGGGDGIGTTTPSQVITFRGTAPVNETIYMSKNNAFSSGGMLAIDIKANNISNTYGVAFDVDFDSSKITYDGYIVGSYLEAGGGTVNYFVSPQTGKLVVGISRLTGVVSGSGTIVTLKFKSIASGDTPVSFNNNIVRDANNQTIPAVTWNGGTATILF